MNDFSDWAIKRAEEKEKHKNAQFAKFKEHLPKIKEQAVSSITIDYCGGGDSGEIQNLIYCDVDGREIYESCAWGCKDPTALSKIFEAKNIPNAQYRGTTYRTDAKTGESVREQTYVDGSLNDIVEDVAYSLLPSGWEVNEGSRGTITFHLDETPVKVELEHGWEIIKTEWEAGTYEI